MFFHELSQCLFDFVIQLLPTNEEMAIKEDVRRLLEKLIKTIEPDSRLLSFGSTANGFSLRNSGAPPFFCLPPLPSAHVALSAVQIWTYVVCSIRKVRRYRRPISSLCLAISSNAVSRRTRTPALWRSAYLHRPI